VGIGGSRFSFSLPLPPLLSFTGPHNRRTCRTGAPG